MICLRAVAFLAFCLAPFVAVAQATLPVESQNTDAIAQLLLSKNWPALLAIALPVAANFCRRWSPPEHFFHTKAGAALLVGLAASLNAAAGGVMNGLSWSVLVTALVTGVLSMLAVSNPTLVSQTAAKTLAILCFLIPMSARADNQAVPVAAKIRKAQGIKIAPAPVKVTPKPQASPTPTASVVVPEAALPALIAAQWKPILWQGVLALASFDLVGRRFLSGVNVNLGWAAYIPLPNPSFSLVFGGAEGHDTNTATWTTRPYIGVGFGGQHKVEPSYQVGLCPPLLVIVNGYVQMPRFSICTGGALPII